MILLNVSLFVSIYPTNILSFFIVCVCACFIVSVIMMNRKYINQQYHMEQDNNVEKKLSRKFQQIFSVEHFDWFYHTMGYLCFLLLLSELIHFHIAFKLVHYRKYFCNVEWFFFDQNSWLNNIIQKGCKICSFKKKPITKKTPLSQITHFIFNLLTFLSYLLSNLMQIYSNHCTKTCVLCFSVKNENKYNILF